MLAQIVAELAAKLVYYMKPLEEMDPEAYKELSELPILAMQLSDEALQRRIFEEMKNHAADTR